MPTKRFVSETPSVNGGYPVVVGSRTPIRVLLEYCRQHDDDLQRVNEALPHLRLEQIQGALNYYAICPNHVDEDKQRNVAAWERYSGRSWAA